MKVLSEPSLRVERALRRTDPPFSPTEVL